MGPRLKNREIQPCPPPVRRVTAGLTPQPVNILGGPGALATLSVAAPVLLKAVDDLLKGPHESGSMISAPLAGLLFGAGLLAGAMNAVAGGGTFVALPILTLAGLPPTVANASTTAALFPGTLASTWAYRKDVRPLDGASAGALLILSLAGGLVGALLLLFTPQHAFTKIIPWLLLLAALTLASGQRAVRGLRRLGLHFGRRTLYVAQFVLGVYGGYFGGAVGLMMLAVWSLAAPADLRRLTPLRTVMVAAANGIAVICFATTGNVSWPESLVVMAGGVAGGYVGARIGWRLPAGILRALILSVIVVTTAGFFARAYLG